MSRTLPVAAGVVLAVVAPIGDALAAPYASRTLEQGSSGRDVRALQRYLDRTGQETDVDGQFGPATASSVRAFEADEGRRVDGRASRGEQRLVRQRAASAETEQVSVTEPLDRATLGPDGLAVPPASAPEDVKQIIAAGNRIARKPYKYGGGHGRWRDTGYDCSGSVSYALHGAGLLDAALDSGAFASFGERGRGEWVTIRTNPSHAYMVVAGLRFDTSARKRGTTRWTERMRSPRGYVARHPEGL
ncbi:MAG TPA: peptidoglycan-binding protein [Thermoleophilaceae bacterium]|nr:peptidoglycan-binding protein [Thermoleophilaceae bacterium]